MSVTRWQKFYTDDMNQCWHNKSSHMWHSKRKVVWFYVFSWSIMVKFCVLLQMSYSKTQMLFLKKNIFQENRLFCRRFMAFYILPPWPLVFCLLFVNDTSNNTTTMAIPIRAPDHISDRFYVISMEFLSLRRKRSSWQMSLVARSKEKWLYSQPNHWAPFNSA